MIGGSGGGGCSLAMFVHVATAMSVLTISQQMTRTVQHAPIIANALMTKNAPKMKNNANFANKLKKLRNKITLHYYVSVR